MRILIVRMFPYEMNIKNYNVQEIGLARALIEAGNECDIVFYTNNERSYEQLIQVGNQKKIKIYWIKGKNYFKNVKYEEDIFEIIKRYDVIQLSEYDQLQNIEIIKKANKPIVIYHGPYYKEFNLDNFKYNIKCKIQDALFINKNKEYMEVPIIAKSKLAEDFLRKKGFKNVFTIGVGLDTTRLNNNIETNNNFINRLQEEKNKNKFKYLLYVGKIEKRRNIKFLIKVLYDVLIQRTDVRLIMVGNGNDKYKKNIFKFAKKLGVYDKIYYKENIGQDDIASLYKVSDIFLLPTSYEIFGMVILEAMYMGVPTITTINGGSSTVVNNNENGFVCSLKKRNDWVTHIIRLMESKDVRNKISNNASNKIKNEYTWNFLSSRFIDVYEEAITKFKIKKVNY